MIFCGDFSLQTSRKRLMAFSAPGRWLVLLMNLRKASLKNVLKHVQAFAFFPPSLPEEVQRC